MLKTKKKASGAPRSNVSTKNKRYVDESIHDSCLRMLVPLAALLLRAGVGVGEFSDLCRHAYVKVAKEMQASPRKRTNVSRIAVATGLTRQEVARLLRAEKPIAKRIPKQLHRANRVLAGWYVDRRFTLESGVPRPLAVKGSGHTFHRLVRDYGGDVPPRAVLDELRRADAVRNLKDGAIIPTRRRVAYGLKSEAMLRGVAQKLRLLAETLRNNVDDPAATLFEDVIVSSPLRTEHFPIAVHQLSNSARRFLSASRHYLARGDRQVKKRGRSSKSNSLGVGIFLFSKNRVNA